MEQGQVVESLYIQCHLLLLLMLYLFKKYCLNFKYCNLTLIVTNSHSFRVHLITKKKKITNHIKMKNERNVSIFVFQYFYIASCTRTQ